jgi:UDP-N-acetylmuramoylalanine--D-glutamate ligase
MMFPAHIFAGQRIGVVGLGRNGLAAARALRAMGAEVTAWDDNAAAREAAAGEGIAVAEPDMARVEMLVLSPGIAHRLPRAHPIAARAIAAGVPILSDADLLYRAVRAAGSAARFVGITGTNGKSTTTALLAHILAGAGVPVAAGGNLGTASLALALLGDDGVYVLEMSSYMLERIATMRFDVAGMLNLSADHLDRHGDMAGYAAAKRAIFERQTSHDVAVIGIDDAWSRDMATALRGRPARVATISAATKADVWARDGVLRDHGGIIADLAGARALPGAHNAQNAAAAAAMALALGVPREKIQAGIMSYGGLPHRQEHVGDIGGVTFINDSKATNADSAACALACYGRVIWIAGGEAKAGGIESLAGYFPRIAEALLIGRDAPVLAATLAAHGVRHRDVGTLAAAVDAAWRDAQAGLGDVVLLSPACASWDQFTGFDQRGEQFRALVQELARASAGGQTLSRKGAA